MLEERERFPPGLRRKLRTLTNISPALRRDLAFYGAEDLTPSDFNTREVGERACTGARMTEELVQPHVISS